jgi:hypothetical protein
MVIRTAVRKRLSKDMTERLFFDSELLNKNRTLKYSNDSEILPEMRWVHANVVKPYFDYIWDKLAKLASVEDEETVNAFFTTFECMKAMDNYSYLTIACLVWVSGLLTYDNFEASLNGLDLGLDFQIVLPPDAPDFSEEYAEHCLAAEAERAATAAPDAPDAPDAAAAPAAPSSSATDFFGTSAPVTKSSSNPQSTAPDSGFGAGFKFTPSLGGGLDENTLNLFRAVSDEKISVSEQCAYNEAMGIADESCPMRGARGGERRRRRQRNAVKTVDIVMAAVAGLLSVGLSLFRG